MPLIKRYSNRKLYDCETKSYVTLEQISLMVQNGEDIRVIDHESGEDITAITLTQVISDLEKRIGGYTPPKVIYQLINGYVSGISPIQQGINCLLQPFEFVNQEITRRLNLLVDEEKISREQYSTLLALILDERFKSQQDDQLKDSTKEELQSLDNQLKNIEEELAQLRKKRM